MKLNKFVSITIVIFSIGLFLSQEVSSEEPARQGLKDPEEQSLKALLDEGRRFYSQGLYLESTASFKKALAVEPQNRYAKEMLKPCWKRLISEGEKYMEEPFDAEKAIAYFTAARSLEPYKIGYVDSLIKQVNIKRAIRKAETLKEKMLLDVDKTWTLSSVKDLAGKTKAPSEEKETARFDEDLKGRLEKKVKVIDFNNASLKEVIKNLSEMTGVNIVLDEDVLSGVMPEGITIYLTDITLLQALEIILKTSGLKYRLEKSYILVTTADKLVDEELMVQVYDVQDIVGKLHDFPGEALKKSAGGQ